MLSKRGIEISSAKLWLNQLHKWAMAGWDVANGKTSVILFTSWYRKSKFCSTMKLARSDIFRLYLIER